MTTQIGGSRRIGSAFSQFIKGAEIFALLCAVVFVFRGAGIAQTKQTTPSPKPKAASATAPHSATTPKPDLAKTPTLYVVGYAHLDTQWRWEYPQVISEYILRRRCATTSRSSRNIRTTFSISAARTATA